MARLRYDGTSLSDLDLHSETPRRLKLYPMHPRIILSTQALRVAWVVDRTVFLNQEDPDIGGISDADQYDEVLSDTLRWFPLNNIERLDIILDDASTAYRLPIPNNPLSTVRTFSYLPKTIDASLAFLSTPSLTSIELTGLRSKHDHNLAITVLSASRYLRELQVEYHADFAFPEGGTADDGEGLLEMKKFWTALGQLERLRHLQMLYFPTSHDMHDPSWEPDVWLPKLRSLGCNEITGALLQRCIGDGSTLRYYMGCEEGLYNIETTADLAFPQVREVEMFLDDETYFERFLRIFKKSPLTQLSMETLNLRRFLDLYIQDQHRHPTLKSLVCRHGELEDDIIIPDDSKATAADVVSFKQVGIDLLLPEESSPTVGSIEPSTQPSTQTPTAQDAQTQTAGEG